MAGDWIKMRVDLADDPAVIGIAATTALDEDTVVGKLHRLWAWADQQTIDGNAVSVTKSWVDRYLRADGFAEAMTAAGWLETDSRGIHFPRFERHNGESGKRRALTAKRVARHKAEKGNAKGNARSVTTALPREEKRREDTNTPCSPPRGTRASRQKFIPPSHAEVAAYCKERDNTIDPQEFLDHYDANGWKRGSTPIRDWKACIRTWEARRCKENPPAESRFVTTEEYNRMIANGEVQL